MRSRSPELHNRAVNGWPDDAGVKFGKPGAGGACGAAPQCG